MFKRTVIRFFGIFWEKAARQFATRQMRMQAIAADAPFAARIGTGTFQLVFFDLAFHGNFLSGFSFVNL